MTPHFCLRIELRPAAVHHHILVCVALCMVAVASACVRQQARDREHEHAAASPSTNPGSPEASGGRAVGDQDRDTAVADVSTAPQPSAPWVFQVVDDATSKRLESVAVALSPCPSAMSDGGYTIALDPAFEVAKKGIVRRDIVAGNWAFKISSPGYAARYGLLESDHQDSRVQTVRLSRGASIQGVFTGPIGARIECEVNEEHSASQPHLTEVWHCGGLKKLFQYPRHVALVRDDGTFEITDLPAAAFVVTATVSGKVLWQTRAVITTAGAASDLGLVP